MNYNKKTSKITKNMTNITLPNIDETVIAALDFFSKNPPKKLDLKKYKNSIVVGSGNAYNIARAIFSTSAIAISNESDFKETLAEQKQLIKTGLINKSIIISASGEKDSIWEIKLAKKYGLKTVLLTCNANSGASLLADKVIVYQKLSEPYTYNVSTYLGMLLSITGEKAIDIKKYIMGLKLPDFKRYKAYSFILPDKVASIVPMLEIKRDELFGPFVSLRAFSFGGARHAKFVNNSKDELVISLGENKYFGLPENRWEIKIPSKIQLGLAMALNYYLIGKIQSTKKPYFKKNIAKYCQEGPSAYGQTKPFSVIVE